METELNGHLPFLNTDIYSRPDASLEHTAYKKPTHTNLHLNAELHQHPACNNSVLSWYTELGPSVIKKFPGELEFLCSTFIQNGYSELCSQATSQGGHTQRGSDISCLLTHYWTNLQLPQQGVNKP